jgi:hypothetical protein
MAVGYSLPYFMPHMGWWKQAAQCSSVCILTQLPFESKSEQRRCILTSAQGPQTVSLALIGGRNKGKAVADVVLDWTQPSMKDLPQAIATNYGKTAYFDLLYPEFLDIYHQKPAFLWEFNLNLLRWAQHRLGLHVLFVQDTCGRDKPPGTFNLEVTSETYLQMFDDKIGFVAEAGTFDLLFNLGPDFAGLNAQGLSHLQ